MTTKNCDAHAPGAYGPGLIPVLVIGALVGLVFSGDVLTASSFSMVMAFCWGVALSFLYLQWVDMAGQSLALLGKPFPPPAELANRAELKNRIEKPSLNPVHLRIQNLLETWARGLDPRAVIELAAFQSARARRTIFPETVFMAALMLIAWRMGGPESVTISGLAALALTWAARLALTGRIDGMIERHLLSQLPGNLPQTAMTAAELAGALGGSIENAFKKYIPQPEEMGHAMRKGIDEASLRFAHQIKDLHDSLHQNQSTLIQAWSGAAKTTTQELRDVEKALSTVVSDLTGGLHANAEKMKLALTHHTQEIQKVFADITAQLKHCNVDGASQLQDALKGHVDMLAKTSQDWSAQFKAVLGEHLAAQKSQAGQQSQDVTNWNKQLQTSLGEQIGAINSSAKALAGQLEQIAHLSKNIEKVLHVQETVETSFRSVSSTEEFRATMEALRKHIEESDNLLREVSKPRTIRLVETEEEIREV